MADLTPGSISIGVDRLVARGLVQGGAPGAPKAEATTFAPPLARLSLILDPFSLDDLNLSLARRNVNGSPLIRRIPQTQDSPDPTNCTLPAQGDIRKSFDRFDEVRLEVTARRQLLHNGSRQHRQSSSLDPRVTFCKRFACALLFVDIEPETSNEANKDCGPCRRYQDQSGRKPHQEKSVMHTRTPPSDLMAGVMEKAREWGTPNLKTTSEDANILRPCLHSLGNPF